MKRALTGIAAAAVVLGAVSPMAFAATTTSGLTKANQLPIVVNGSVLSNPYEMTGQDSGNTTAFFPVYYFNQALNQIGYTATWDGVTHTWAITAPGVDASTVASSIAGGVGTGNTTITVNGTVVKKINTQAAKDPAASKTAAATTYFPAYYIDEIFNGLGAKVSFSGQTGLSIQTATNTAGSQLSAITETGATSGTGSSTSPAVSLNNANVTLSTTLTDANGNPVSGTAVNFQVSEYGNYPSSLPTVSNASGTVISGTSSSNYESYTAYTNASGVASITVAGPAGQTYAYEVIATAPYQGSTGMTVSSAPSYVEFVANNEAAISPYAGSATPFGAAMGTAVPITVALPTNSAGAAQSNVLVTLTTTGSAYFTNASGADLGQSIQVSTNASGLAQTYLNDANAETVSVSASLPAGLGLNNPQSTYIDFAQSGVATQVNNYSISATSGVEAGQNVTVSGTLVDAAGNPVANGQALVVGNDVANGSLGSTNSGDFGYISNGTVVDFPNDGNVSDGAIALTQGMNATSSVGDLITADANGNFSFQVTDTNDDENATFSIYGVSNGEVTSVLKSDTIDFSAGTTLTSIALGGTDSQADANTYKSLTGLSAQNHNSAAPIFVDPQNAAGNPLTQQSLNYNLSVNNGGTVSAITSADGTQTLPINSSNPGLAAVNVSVAYNSASDNYTITVPGQSGSITSSTPDFGVQVYNSNTGATNLTISSGSVSSTAAYTFTGGTATWVNSFSPVSSTLSQGQDQQVTFTVEDANGNPVANTLVYLNPDSTNSADPLWITEVNGVALDQSENMGNSTNSSYATEPTPIPLGSAPSDFDGYTVNESGVVAWNGVGNNIGLYTDANGQISLTLQNGGVTYYNNKYGLSSSVGATSGSDSFWSYATKGDSANSALTYQLAVAPNATSDGAAGFGSSAEQVGVVYFGSGSTTTTTPTSTGLDYALGGTGLTTTANGSAALTVSAATNSGAITVTDPAGYSEQINVYSGDSASTVANMIASAFNNDSTYTTADNYTVAASGGTVTFTKADATGTPSAPTLVNNGSAGVTGTGYLTAAAAGSQTVTLSGAVTSAGTLTVTVDGQSVSVPYTAGEELSNIVSALDVALNSNSTITANYSVAVTSTDQITITALTNAVSNATVTVSGATNVTA